MRKTSIFIAFLIVSMGLVFSATCFSAAAPKKPTRRAAPPISTPATDTSERLALVIGNSQYAVGRLKNPVNDATDMAANLERLGFKVILEKNAGQEGMEEAIREFGRRLKKGGVGLFFYAGHGLQINGRNYLIPIGARIEKETDAKYKAIDAEMVLDEMTNAGNPMNIVILDACRDNPLVGRTLRTAGKGLAMMSDLPQGTLITYSTSPGKTAADGEGRNSPYTTALLKAINEPGLPIEQVFKRVRQHLSREKGNKQIPWELSSLQGEFYFNPSTRPEKPKEEKQTAGLGVQSRPEDPELEKEQKKIAEERRRLEAEKAQLEKDRKRIEQEQKLEEERQKLAEEKKRIDEEKQALAEQKKKKVKKEKKTEEAVAMAPRPSAPSSVSSFTDSTTGIEMILVRGGCYQMGDTFGDGEGDEKPVHEACVDDFYLGKFEVTQGQWRAIMGNNPSYFSSCGDNCPVETVSWNDAQEFIRKLNDRTGKRYRLPTEAEWEYAARSGGKAYKYSWGNGQPSGNIADESAKRKNSSWTIWEGYDDGYPETAPVGRFNPNELGLYDMTGNVWEWCQDTYNSSAYQQHSRNNPIYTGSGSNRVIRGGSWSSGPRYVRAADRDSGTPDNRDYHLGFRLAGPK